jgi:hypothetical protein
MGKGLRRCKTGNSLPWDATGRQGKCQTIELPLLCSETNDKGFSAPTLPLSSKDLHTLIFS